MDEKKLRFGTKAIHAGQHPDPTTGSDSTTASPATTTSSTTDTLAGSTGILGSGLQIATHAAGKITLFFCAGAIYVASHKTEVSQLDGIGRSMPWTMGAFAIGAISMIGLPPAVGFVSKWYMLSGAMATAHWTAGTSTWPS